MKTEFSFKKKKNRLWIETDCIGMLLFDKQKNKPIRVAIKVEGKDLLRLFKMLERIGFPMRKKE